jgi:hypothetical protein
MQLLQRSRVSADAIVALSFSFAFVLSTASACSSTMSTSDGGSGGADGGSGSPDAPEGSFPDVSVDVVEPDVHPTVQVPMSGYNQEGTGANTQETFLNITNVSGSTFGKLFERSVDGDQFAEPLYVGALKMPDGKTHNVIYVATEHDSVYAFDADDATATAPLWHKSLGTSTPLPSPYLSFQWAGTTPSCGQFVQRESGITGTPVIDPKTNTMYVVALNVDGTHTTPGGTCLDVSGCASGTATTMTCNFPKITYQLHALDILTGDEKLGGPVDVGATVTGSGAGSQSGKLTFDPGLQLARPSLLLVNGSVYFGAGSYNDAGNYHGWLFAYDAATLAQKGVMNDTPNGTGGGVWQSGRSMVADSEGNLYVVTGQGTFTHDTGGSDYGDSVLKLNADLSKVSDYFTQYLSDYQSNNFPNDWDDDLGSAGATLIPGTQMMLVSGKMGIGFLLDTHSLGEWNPSGDKIVQELRIAWRPGTVCVGGSHGVEAYVYATPVAWVGPDGTHVYVWANGDNLREYLLDGDGKFKDSGDLCWCAPWMVGGKGGTVNIPSDPNCAAAHTEGAVNAGPLSAGGAMAVSSNGTEAGTGILWTTYGIPGTSGPIDGIHGPVVGAMAAYDATNAHDPIWVSTDKSSDALGNWAKFVPPTVANGKVYVATFSNKLMVYGLLGK